MSNISSFHKIAKFVSGVSSALDGQSLVISRGNAKSKTESICASVPALTAQEVMQESALLPHILSYLESVRSGIIRKAANEGKEEIRSEEISAAGIAAYLDALALESGRLTKEDIKKYLEDKEQKDTLFVAFAIALKYEGDTLTEEQIAKISFMFKGFVDILCELAGSRTYWEEKKRNTAKKYLLTLEDCAMKERLLGKIEAMEQAKKESEQNALEALGF